MNYAYNTNYHPANFAIRMLIISLLNLKQFFSDLFNISKTLQNTIINIRNSITNCQNYGYNDLYYLPQVKKSLETYTYNHFIIPLLSKKDLKYAPLKIKESFQFHTPSNSNAEWVYYNSRTEVTSAAAANDPLYNFNYNFDAIGNRKTYGTAESGLSVTNTYYADDSKNDVGANSLNQYEKISDGTNDTDLSYDADGSIVSDGKYTYTWNGENRLISVTSLNDPADLDYKKLEFSYDYMGRRVSKKVWKWVKEEAPIVIPPEVQAQIDAVEAQREKMLTQEAEQLDKMLANIDEKIAKVLEKKKGNWQKQIEIFEKQKEHEKDKTEQKNETINTNADRQIAQIYEDAGIDPDDTVEGDPVWMLAEDLRFVYDGYKKIETLDAANSNAVTRKNVWSGETLLSENDGTSTYYALADANKNVTEYLDSAGDVRAHYEYSPFGKITEKTGDMADDFNYRFSSEVFDTETGLVYYNYRYYSPELGRWLSRDPIGEDGGYNLYSMVGNNPVFFWDRLGLKKCRKCRVRNWKVGGTFTIAIITEAYEVELTSQQLADFLLGLFMPTQFTAQATAIKRVDVKLYVYVSYERLECNEKGEWAWKRYTHSLKEIGSESYSNGQKHVLVNDKEGLNILATSALRKAMEKMKKRVETIRSNLCPH